MANETASTMQSHYGSAGDTAKPLNYNTYLMIEELTKLQVCQSEPAHHDEPLFIIIHQTYELWFKLILHEFDAVITQMNAENVPRASFFMRRVVAIFKLLVQQIHLLETMTPKDFLAFRKVRNFTARPVKCIRWASCRLFFATANQGLSN